MKVQSAAEYSIEYYSNMLFKLKEDSNRIFKDGLETKREIVEFYKRLEELKQYNRKKDIVTKDKVDVIV